MKRHLLSILSLLIVLPQALYPRDALASPKKYADFCSATQSDDCIGVSKGGEVYDFYERKIIGKAIIKRTPNGIVANYAGSYFCGKSDARISKSYLVCSKDGWQLSRQLMNISDPWNPTDPWAND